MKQHTIIVGTGLAGLSTAICLADHAEVTLISKNICGDGASIYAQGGIAASKNCQESQTRHIEDTLKAGCYHNHTEHVTSIIRESHEAINWLTQQGVQFDHINNHPSLHQEGGHQERRIYHIADTTGAQIIDQLRKHVRNHPHITVLENHIAIDLVQEQNQVQGLIVLDENNQQIKTLYADYVCLATGGASKVYLYASNPETASGDGLAMALRAGVESSDLAFNQFHPTCLYHPKARSFLITEAMRGEGAKLLLPDQTPFMHRFHPDADLAPRDTVARAIDFEIKRLGIKHVFLDISHRESGWIQSAFPNIYSTCLELGIDITKEPIPVVPAAHYTCGGIKTDTQGQTSINRLYAIGEVACTGLHGANRLASNSLLECITMAINAARAILLQNTTTQKTKPTIHQETKPPLPQSVIVQHTWEACRNLMWNYVGIVRSNQRLNYAYDTILLLEKEINHTFSSYHPTRALIECRNLILVSKAIIHAAQKEKRNIGLHFNEDLCSPSKVAQNETAH